jgi:hypothetical protein
MYRQTLTYCLLRITAISSLQRTLAEYTAHRHRERNHQGRRNRLLLTFAAHATNMAVQ